VKTFCGYIWTVVKFAVLRITIATYRTIPSNRILSNL